MALLQSQHSFLDIPVSALALNKNDSVVNYLQHDESPNPAVKNVLVTKKDRTKKDSSSISDETLVGLQNKKRNINSSTILDVSTKLTKGMLGFEDDTAIRPLKRNKWGEHLVFVQRRVSIFEALTSALEKIPHLQQKSDIKLVEDYQDQKPDSITSSFDCQNSKGMYNLPLNTALKNKQVGDGVLEMLVTTDPSCLEIKDGYDGSSSLSIALLKRSCNIDIVTLLLGVNPNCVRVADNRSNLPLHVACACGGYATLDLIQQLYQLYPEACNQRNIHGETPLNIAKRNRMCSKDVVDFLQKVSSN